MRYRSGFVSTLESVIASTLFLIVIISVLPAFVSSPDPTLTVQKVMVKTVQSLQRTGEIERYVERNDTEGLAGVVAEHISGWTVEASMLKANMTEGRASPGDTDVPVSIDGSLMERARLLLWTGVGDAVNISIGGTDVASVSRSGVVDVDLTEGLSDGMNTVTLSVDGSAVPYRVETYNRYGVESFPETEVISHTRLVEDGNASYEPSEVIVYAWQ